MQKENPNEKTVSLCTGYRPYADIFYSCFKRGRSIHNSAMRGSAYNRRKNVQNEWYGAYHKFMNNEKGNYDYSDNPSPDVEDKANQCKGFDIYMYWYDDPNESGKLLDVKKGGLYICVVAQDKTYGTIFNDGEASNASDCFQLAIDPFNYRLSNSKKAFIFDFSPETTKRGRRLYLSTISLNQSH